MRHSLRLKAFRMNIIPVAAAVIVFMVLGIYQVRRFANLMEQTSLEQNEVIMDTMSDTMKSMTTENYQKYLVSRTEVLNSEFWTMRHDLEVLASQVQSVLESSSPGRKGVSAPSKEDAGTLTLQLLYSEKADRSDPVLQDKIQRVGALDAMMLEIVEDTGSLADCVVSLEGGASIVADRVPELKFDSDGEILPFNALRRPWYVGALVHEDTYFTPMNVDAFSGDSQVMVGVPVYVDGTLQAVCGGSIRMESMGNILSGARLGEYSDTCMINENGNIVYSSRLAGELALDSNRLKSLKESSNAQLVSLVNEALSGDVGFDLVTLDHEKTYIAYAPVETVGWTQLLLISQEDLNRAAVYLLEQTNPIMEESLVEVRSTETQTILSTLALGGGLLFLAVLVSMLFANGLVRPIRRMTERVSQMQGEDMTFEMEKAMYTGDEIEILAKTFESMSIKMKGYVREIVQITAEKQRLDTELSVATDIQYNMLPNRFPAFPDRGEFDLYAVMDPAREVGGDFYDFFLIDEDHLAIVIADVSGKGVPAALFMVISKTMIKNVTLSGHYSGPAQILSKVNDLLCEGNEDDMFVTAWLGVLTISTGSLVSACAGHEYPVFYREGQGFVMERDPHGMPMGGMEGIQYKEVEWKMNSGDMLFLYTDGVPEANNNQGELFGNERMLSSLETSKDQMSGEGGGSQEINLNQFLRLVRVQIDDFVGDTPQFDDLTMLCLEYRSRITQPEEGEQGQTPKTAAKP